MSFVMKEIVFHDVKLIITFQLFKITNPKNNNFFFLQIC